MHLQRLLFTNFRNDEALDHAFLQAILVDIRRMLHLRIQNKPAIPLFRSAWSTREGYREPRKIGTVKWTPMSGSSLFLVNKGWFLQ